ncbi:Mg-protoporphyrin IX methyl transferase [Actinomyces bovis]|uniref:Mg-protoporphyrin IX methyl transferase n=1 Tax=Actinomyces bovis TaxID=1658 RepID=A0ABY1VSP6_9ACTO|nr:class I SAM-dependent methyltransferase [Actinomyces bovis]SPT54432.1 Mg-protoporphyrin IX methyl transferase [Actinomyces bovis]VEG55974.1 Mg-protoporphyrin IX methyl transferase [Actinomyces israelii]
MPESIDQPLPSLHVGQGAKRFHELSLRDDTEITSVLELLEQQTDPQLKDLRVLELACGTGRVTLPLAASGHRVLATDRAPDLLAILRERLADRSMGCPKAAAQVEVQQADPATFQTEEKFKAVCLMSAAITLLDPAKRTQTLKTAVSHLAPGGQLIVSTDLVAVTHPTTTKVMLWPRITLTESVNPAAGTRRTVLAWEQESYATDLFLYPPATLSADLRRLGLSTEFQRSTQDPALPHHSNVVIGASVPR